MKSIREKARRKFRESQPAGCTSQLLHAGSPSFGGSFTLNLTLHSTNSSNECVTLYRRSSFVMFSTVTIITAVCFSCWLSRHSLSPFEMVQVFTLGRWELEGFFRPQRWVWRVRSCATPTLPSYPVSWLLFFKAQHTEFKISFENVWKSIDLCSIGSKHSFGYAF